MKNLLVANRTDGKKQSYRQKNIPTMLKAQIENSLELFWEPKDIIILSNFDFEHEGVKAIKIDLNEFCLTGSKMFATKWFFENFEEDVVWSHDLDAWQNAFFKEPDFKDVGIATYSTSKYNGGSIFWKKSAKDIIDSIVQTIEKEKSSREEPTINKLLKGKEFKDRVTVLNNTFNVGCSGFVKRLLRSERPIKVCHFHPYNRIAWETHTLDRNGLDEVSVCPRLNSLIRRFFPDLPTDMKGDGKKKAADLRRQRYLKFKEDKKNGN